jgi:hypothetical protein
MSSSLGKRLTGLQKGDSVVVTVDGEQYTGEVIDKNRQKCDLVAGVMEDGYIGVYLQLDSETVDKYGLTSEHLVMGATEEVAGDFEPPTASVYDISEKESITSLGEIEDITEA